ncbi:DUF1275 domain-containing protein [Sphaerisporangium album]|uniref:DUF1275 domain-containing protein n=1 Tax=Sphaerisporangium album TaxID=509200 RepID=A0A367F852_9ACTN|nr:YoaK family protein [Sphaerisporangium album]RCG26534.1 DUF1275 domain-containing protein [Sphaerisporangium album]
MASRTRGASRDPLPPALLALTLLSGCVDAVSLLAMGRVFTANMTGNVVILGLAAAGTPGFSAVASLTSLLGFMAGALAAGRLGVHVPSSRARVLISLAAETVLIAVAAGVSSRSRAVTGGYDPVVALVALAMGLQFATVRLLGIPDLTTTIQTRILTGLVADSRLAGGEGPRAGRRIASVLTLVLGAFAGAQAYRAGGVARTLAAVAVCVALIAVVYAVRSRPRGAGPAGTRPRDEGP